MPKLSYVNGQASIVLRVKIRDSASTTGAGLAGLTTASAGLIISTLADNEATATAYTQAAGNIEAITTLGTFAAPTAGKCRFKEVDATNHPGLYEIQIADARWAVSSAKGAIVSLSGAANMVETDAEVELVSFDHHNAAPDVTLANKTHTGAVIPTVTTLTGNTPQTGDNFAGVSSIIAKLPSTAFLRGTSKADGADEDVDGVSDASFRELTLAYLAGQSTLVDHGGGSKTITYKKQDGTTAKLAITFNTSGEFTATVIS